MAKYWGSHSWFLTRMMNSDGWKVVVDEGGGGWWRVAGIAEVVLFWFMNFCNFSNCWDCTVYARQGRGRGDGRRRRDWSGGVVARFWFMTAVINAHGYYPLEKKRRPLDWSCVLLHVWHAGAIWPPFVFWRWQKEKVIFTEGPGNISFYWFVISRKHKALLKHWWWSDQIDWRKTRFIISGKTCWLPFYL